jgi:hypothetical protein
MILAVRVGFRMVDFTNLDPGLYILTKLDDISLGTLRLTHRRTAFKV